MRIAKYKLIEIISALSSKVDVFAPVKVNGVTNFHKIDGETDIDLDTVRTKTPPKEVIFRQSEKTMKIKTDDGKILGIDDITEINDTIIFGIRPCDAKGIGILDNFFMDTERKDGGEQKHADPLWKQRREKTLIMSVVCTKPMASCACTSLGIHPASEVGSDILFIPDGDGFVVMGVTDNGKQFLSVNSEYFSSEGDAETTQKSVKEKCESMMSFSIPTENAGKLMSLYKNQEIWERVSRGCISCGICTFLCPTCHCFEARDKKTSKNESVRIKCWDSCKFSPYSLEASGHHPRPTVADRFKNRILDKFQYHVTLYDEIACTGCGRCSDFCPAGITLTDTLTVLGGVL